MLSTELCTSYSFSPKDGHTPPIQITSSSTIPIQIRRSLFLLHPSSVLPPPSRSTMPRPLPGHLALKDFNARKAVAANELLRRAYLYIVRNETLDSKIRTAAMLKLNAFPRAVSALTLSWDRS